MMNSSFKRLEREIATGTEFEGEFIELLSPLFDGKIESCVGSYLDKEQGTDLLVDGYRFDLTTDFIHKDNTEVLEELTTCLGRFATVKVGIRTGNCHNGFTPFEKPVIVIGFLEPFQFIKRNLEAVMEELANSFMDIFLDATYIYDERFA